MMHLDLDPGGDEAEQPHLPGLIHRPQVSSKIQNLDVSLLIAEISISESQFGSGPRCKKLKKPHSLEVIHEAILQDCISKTAQIAEATLTGDVAIR